MDLKLIGKYAKRHGLGGVAITDHNTMRGLLPAKRIFKDYGLLLVPGAELALKGSDVLIYFVEESKILEIDDIYELIDFVHENHGIIALAHPYRPGYKLPPEKTLKHIDAIEVFNSQCTKKENQMAENLRERYGKCAVAGSDAHIYSYIGLGAVDADCTTLDELRENILNGNIKIASKIPNRLTRACNIFGSIWHMPGDKKRYFLTHPWVAVKKILRKL